MFSIKMPWTRRKERLEELNWQRFSDANGLP
jgi:hypothetical protein